MRWPWQRKKPTQTPEQANQDDAQAQVDAQSQPEVSSDAKIQIDAKIQVADQSNDTLPEPGPGLEFAPEGLEPTSAQEAKAEPEAKVIETRENSEPRRNWFQRLSDGLSRSSAKVSEGITSIFTRRKLDVDMLEELEDLLITSDAGVAAAARITQAFSKGRFDREIGTGEVRTALASAIADELRAVEVPFELDTGLQPHVVLVVGVNGSGKTTTIAKLAHHMRQVGHSVMMAAGDTFRAAAIAQLKVWGERTGSTVIAAEQGSDPAALAFDAVTKAKAAGTDLLLIDTAGRLHNKSDLMDELAKIDRVIKKVLPDAPHSVLLVLDATIGQNAIAQVRTFQQTVPLSGLIVTKLDGTAKGGVLLALADAFALPVHAIGVGESADDLQPFSAQEFAQALVGVADTGEEPV